MIDLDVVGLQIVVNESENRQRQRASLSVASRSRSPVCVSSVRRADGYLENGSRVLPRNSPRTTSGPSSSRVPWKSSSVRRSISERYWDTAALSSKTVCELAWPALLRAIAGRITSRITRASIRKPGSCFFLAPF